LVQSVTQWKIFLNIFSAEASRRCNGILGADDKDAESKQRQKANGYQHLKQVGGKCFYLRGVLTASKSIELQMT